VRTWLKVQPPQAKMQRPIIIAQNEEAGLIIISIKGHLAGALERLFCCIIFRAGFLALDVNMEPSKHINKSLPLLPAIQRLSDSKKQLLNKKIYIFPAESKWIRKDALKGN
jgi:hypothetical protein